jgi:Response regulator containing CheY-like receiver domain and AraC-type DNA-binding domain
MSSRILIAEDETIIRMDLRQMLEANGFEVVGEARDGVEAIAGRRELEPDVVLLDIRMPGVDGVECARRIYAERPVPIVMVTAHGDRGLVERAPGAGAFGYLTKPFREADLIPAIRSAVIRHADLLDARRALGSSRATAPSRSASRRVQGRSGRFGWSGDRMGR